MADLFKTTWFVQYGRGGFSFSHFIMGDGYQFAATAAGTVAKAYLKLCGTGVIVNNIRVSRDDIFGDSIVSEASYESFFTVKPDGGGAVKVVIDSTPDAWWTSALLRLGNSASQFGHQFLRGIPDDQVIMNGGLVRGGNWEAAVKSYIKNLVLWGYGNKYVPKGVGSRKKILAMTDNGAAGWTISTSVAHGLQPGNKFRISGFKGADGSIVNQVWIADATPTGTTIVVGPMQSDFSAAPPIKDFGVLWTMEKTFSPYVTDFCGLVRVSERRAGRPSDVLRGRVLIRK